MTTRERLTTERIHRFSCPEGVRQAFLRDKSAPRLAVRATAAGAKSYVFEAKLARQTIRLTLGSVASLKLHDAREAAARLTTLVDQGIDPRPGRTRAGQAPAANGTDALPTVKQAWEQYLAVRQPFWSSRHYKDHLSVSRPGGAPRQRGTGKTRPGPLAGFMALELHTLTPALIEAWATREADKRPTQAGLALRLLRTFISWCSEQPQLAARVDPALAQDKAVHPKLATGKAKKDALLQAQLPAWFAAVRELPPVVGSYLQILLLTGARPGELAALEWTQVDIRSQTLNLRDKTRSKAGKPGTRSIPLTPYVAELLAALPRRNRFVFASASKEQPISRPTRQLARACTTACIEGLTLHGLRRSFRKLSERFGLPASVVARIMGQARDAGPATPASEPVSDRLRIDHERFERWVLHQADVTCTPDSARCSTGQRPRQRQTAPVISQR